MIDVLFVRKLLMDDLEAHYRTMHLRDEDWPKRATSVNLKPSPSSRTNKMRRTFADDRERTCYEAIDSIIDTLCVRDR